MTISESPPLIIYLNRGVPKRFANVENGSPTANCRLRGAGILFVVGTPLLQEEELVRAGDHDALPVGECD